MLIAFFICFIEQFSNTKNKRTKKLEEEREEERKKFKYSQFYDEALSVLRTRLLRPNSAQVVSF